MSEVEVGVVDLNEANPYAYHYQMVETAENNYNGVRQIHEAGSDRMWRPVYFADGDVPDINGRNTPRYAEILVKPNNDRLSTIEKPQPRDDGYDGLPLSISVAAGLGLGPISAGVSYSFPGSDDTDVRPLNGVNGYRWQLHPESGWFTSPDWPTGPSEPDGNVEDVPTAQWDVNPDEKHPDLPDFRWVWAESRYHYD